jgi:hypothetical protein
MKLRGRFSQEVLKYSVGYGANSVLISHNNLQNEKARNRHLHSSAFICALPFITSCPLIHNVYPLFPPNIPPSTCTTTVLSLQAIPW